LVCTRPTIDVVLKRKVGIFCNKSRLNGTRKKKFCIVYTKRISRSKNQQEKLMRIE